METIIEVKLDDGTRCGTVAIKSDLDLDNEENLSQVTAKLRKCINSGHRAMKVKEKAMRVKETEFLRLITSKIESLEKGLDVETRSLRVLEIAARVLKLEEDVQDLIDTRKQDVIDAKEATKPKEENKST